MALQNANQESQLLISLQARLGRLEAKNRLLSWALLAILGVCALLAVLSADDA